MSSGGAFQIKKKKKGNSTNNNFLYINIEEEAKLCFWMKSLAINLFMKLGKLKQLKRTVAIDFLYIKTLY